MIKPYRILIVLMACHALLSAAEQPVVSGAHIVDYGIYNTQQTGETEAPDTSAGYVHLVHERLDPALLKQTTEVPARIGVHFGFRFELEGSPRLGKIGIHVRVTHPQTKNPENGKASTIDEWDADTNIGIPRFTGWAFEQPYEMVTGKWKIELQRGNKILAEKTFNVIAAEQ